MEGEKNINQAVQYYHAEIPPQNQQNMQVINPSEQVVFLPQQPIQKPNHTPNEQIIIVQPVEVIQQSQIQTGDDPTCIYISAFISIFVPLIGLLTICCYGCGANLGRRQRKAFQTLILCILLGLLFNVLFGYYSC